MKSRLLLISLLIPLLSLGESFSIKKLGMQQGLSNSYIVGVTQDKQGFMWFATESGLNRFDGNKLKVYRKNSPVSGSINSNELNQVMADKTDDIIWIATQRTGLNAFNTNTEKFTYYTSDENNPNSIITNDITYISQSADNNIWVSTYYGGVDLFDKKSNTFKHFNQSTIPGFASNHVWCTLDDNQGNLFVGHVFDGLSIINLSEGKAKNYRYNPNDKQSLPANEVLCIYIDKRKNIWIGTNDGLALFNPLTNKFTVFRNQPGNSGSLSSNRILSIKEINDDKLWIGTNQGGINILDLNAITLLDPKFVTFQHIDANDFENGLSHLTVTEIFQDSFKNIWIGTSGGGINIISNRVPFFKIIEDSPYKKANNNLSNNVVKSITIDNENRIWVCTDGGGIDLIENNKITGHFIKKSGELLTNYINASIKDSEGNILLGGDDNSLLSYNAVTRKFKKYITIPINTGILCIFEDSKKNIWLGTYRGLFSFNPKTGDLKEYTVENSKLTDNAILSISQDSNGLLWVGTLGQGLAIFNDNFEIIKSINTYNGFCSNAINSIIRDSKNRMWVGTREGLVLFNPSNNFSYKVYNELNGMSDSYICAIAEGSSDIIWFSTNTGISKLNVKNNNFVNFNHLDGIPRTNFLLSSVAKSKSGDIFFGSQSGICYFNSTKNQTDSPIGPVTLTDFSYLDRKVSASVKSINKTIADKIYLKYYQNTFSIGYNNLNYGINMITEFEYMLKGLDNSWYNVGNEKQVTFRNIPPGTYDFIIKSRLRNQNWSDSLSTMQIIVEPPFWLTWWAKTIYLILIILLIRYIIVFYKRKLQLENSLYLEQKNHQQEQELNDEKLRFYTNIAHELRTPLTLIIGPLEDLEIDKNLPEVYTKKISLIHRSANRLLNLINQILEFRKAETQNRKLCVTKGDLSALVSEIGNKYILLNHNKDITIELLIENQDINIYYDPEMITIILDNLISNALKYTIKGNIKISLRQSSRNSTNYTEIEVTDTGLGIAEEHQKNIFDRYYQVKNDHQISGSGIGLSLVRSLVELHEGIITVKSEQGIGSIFNLRLLTDNQYPAAIHSDSMQNEEVSTDKLNKSKGVILIVEDNTEIREYIATSFADTFEILKAENGQAGVDLAFEHIPDVIISDIMMPVMDGMELCKILKKDIRTSHIPLILLTAKDTIPDKTEGYKAGADSYITKPFSAGLLQSRVENLIESKKKNAGLVTNSITHKQTILEDSISKLDKEFIEKITKIVEENLDAEQINIAQIADQMNMSHSTLYRKIKALTNISINELIRKIKIQNAEKLLLTGKYNVSEISFMIGINSISYFRQCFKDEYGMSPTEYVKHILDSNKSL